jgi:hypothetical protein
MFLIDGIQLNEKLIDNVFYEWQDANYILNVRFRDGILLRVGCNQDTELATATLRSIAVEIKFDLKDDTYDKLLEWLETEGHMDRSQYGL